MSALKLKTDVAQVSCSVKVTARLSDMIRKTERCHGLVTPRAWKEQVGSLTKSFGTGSKIEGSTL